MCGYGFECNCITVIVKHEYDCNYILINVTLTIESILIKSYLISLINIQLISYRSNLIMYSLHSDIFSHTFIYIYSTQISIPPPLLWPLDINILPPPLQPVHTQQSLTSDKTSGTCRENKPCWVDSTGSRWKQQSCRAGKAECVGGFLREWSTDETQQWRGYTVDSRRLRSVLIWRANSEDVCHVNVKIFCELMSANTKITR